MKLTTEETKNFVAFRFCLQTYQSVYYKTNIHHCRYNFKWKQFKDVKKGEKKNMFKAIVTIKDKPHLISNQY